MGSTSPQRSIAVAVLAATMLVSACSTAAQPRWNSPAAPGTRDAARMFAPEGVNGVMRFAYATEVPFVPPRVKLRPCCAFGAQLQVRVGPVPIPWYFMGNIVDPDLMDDHVYDNGLATLGSRGDELSLVHSEGNGLVYTCRGGFLDIAHVRDYADTTLYLATLIARDLEKGGEFPLPEEGGKLSFRLQPLPSRLVAQEGRWAVAVPLAQWLSQQVSIWHEIATYFGWSTFTLFPEEVSAFSPEDLYSNLLGARIAAAVLSRNGARDEFAYNRNVDTWIDEVLLLLRAVPKETAEEAMLAVDGLWWDSTKRLPDRDLVIRRNFDDSRSLMPWLIPPSRVGPKLRAACGDDPRPMPLANPASSEGLEFSKYVTFVVEVPEEMAAKEPFATIGPRITQKDFPRLLAWLREENTRRYGANADRPNGDAPAARPAAPAEAQPGG